MGMFGLSRLRMLPVMVLAAFFVLITPLAAQAALYAPGATLDPACAPTDPSCGIDTSAMTNLQNTVAGKLDSSVWYATTTDGVHEGTSNLYFTPTRAQTALAGMYEVPLTFSYPFNRSGNVLSLLFGTTTANSWSALQQFNGAASSTLFTSTGSTYLATAGGNVGIGTTSPSARLSVNGNGYLSGSLNVGDAATTRTNLGLTYLSTSNLGAYNIAAWGDSLTQGGSGTYTYPQQLSWLLNGRNVYNGGISGQTSTQIASRMLASPDKYSYDTIIWSGRNDFTNAATVEANIASMVAALGHQRFLIMSIMNGPNEPSGNSNYTAIMAINAYLAATYPNNYLDIRSYIVQNGLTDAGITPTAQDLIDISNDVPPTSLRADSVVHLNTTGYALVAKQVANYIAAHNWDTSTASNILTLSNIAPYVASLNATSTNLLVGSGAGSSVNAAMLNNTSVGQGAMEYATTTSGSVGVGYKALRGYYGIGNNNTAVGTFSLYSSVGSNNTGIGYSALYNNTSGSLNSAVGISSMYSNTTGANNTSSGANALYGNTTGSANVATGYAALYNSSTGSNNTASGVNALRGNTTASNNTAYGYQAGYGTVADNQSVIDTFMTFIGANASRDSSIASTSALTNSIAVGYNAHVYASNQAVFGNDSITTTLLKGKVGIATTSPLEALDVYGNIRFDNIGSAGSGLLGYTASNVGIFGLTRENDITNGTLQIAAYGGIGFSPNSISSIAPTSAGSAMFITTAGNVGIGTTSPGNKFEVWTGANASTLIGSQATAMSGLGLSNITSGIAFRRVSDGNPQNGIFQYDDTAGGLPSLGLHARADVQFINGTTKTFTIKQSGNIGISTTSPATLFEVGGSTANLTLDGYLNCSGFTTNANGLVSCTASDQRLKQDVVQLDASSTLAGIAGLRPVQFYWKPDTNRGTAQQFGLIAQEVQRVFPNLVSTSSPTALTPDGTLTVDYPGLIAPLIVAVQELMKESAQLAQSITTQVVTAVTGRFDNVCVKKADGSYVCITGDQLQKVLDESGQTGSVMVTTSSVTTASTTEPASTNSDGSSSETASSTPETDTTVSPDPVPDTTSDASTTSP